MHTASPKSRAIVYIDGFNLYYGIKNASRQADQNHLEFGGRPEECLGKSLYWLDVNALATSLLMKSEECVAIKYFSAPRCVPALVPITDVERADFEASNERQRVFLEATRSRPLLEVILGWYSEKNPHKCKACGCTWPAFEEKGTDVNIAAAIIEDGFERRCDLAVVVSADADLVAPVEVVRRLGKSVRLALPPGRKKALKLRSIVSDVRNVKIKDVRGLQLPNEVVRQGLSTLRRPREWEAPGRWVWSSSPPTRRPTT